MSNETAAHWRQLHSQLMLLTAWVGPRSERSIEHFLIEAALKSGVNIDVLDFVSDDPADSPFPPPSSNTGWLSWRRTSIFDRISKVVMGIASALSRCANE